MSREQIHEAILKISDNSCEYNCQIKGLIKTMLVFDEYGFDKILTTNTLQIGFEETMLRIVFPFLVEIGILWQVGSIYPAHEHFASHIIKQKLYVAIDGQVGRYTPNRKRFLLFLPGNEQHCMGLLFASYIIRSRGHEVLYLGQEVPFNEMKQLFCEQSCPEYVFTLLTCAHQGMNKQEFVDTLASNWKKSQILLSGLQFLSADIEYPANVKLLRRMEDFIGFVNSLTPDRLN
jgi:methanogenic corrinoid protein MtbC1